MENRLGLAKCGWIKPLMNRTFSGSFEVKQKATPATLEFSSIVKFSVFFCNAAGFLTYVSCDQRFFGECMERVAWYSLADGFQSCVNHSAPNMLVVNACAFHILLP